MISRIFKYLIPLCYLIIFTLSCDERIAQNGSGVGPEDPSGVNSLNIDNNGNLFIDIVDLNQEETVEFSVIPLDANKGKLTDIAINFSILDNGIGYLESSSIIADSSGAQQTFYVNPSSNVNDEGMFNFNEITKIRTYVDDTSVSDTVIIRYENGNLLTENQVLDILSAEPDTIALGEQATITAYLTGTLNGESGVGIPDQYIHFESLLPEDGPDGSVDFGEMYPEYVQTDSDGMASSTFTPLSQTGTGKIRATYDDLIDETYIGVLTGDAINLEIEIPTDNNLMVTGGGGTESVTITAVIKDGGGNIVNDPYAVIFSVPCPFPIDGSCPVGDGDYSNDIMLDGIPSSGTIPIVISETANGEASVTLNSGNRPGIVTMRVQLCEIEDMNESVCDNVIYEAERIVAAISTGPAAYGQVVAGWTEADSTGGGVYSLPITATFWDQWTNPIADSTSVYWYINPEYIASVDPESKIGNCGNGEPGQACTQAYYTSGDIFSQGQICAKVSGQVGSDVLACSGGARCEDFSEFDCYSNEDIGCTWNTEFGECYFIASEGYCNTLFNQESCENPGNSAIAPYNCIWDENAVATIPDWQAEITDGAGCHYSPLVNALDEQLFSYDANGDGYDDLFTGEWEAVGTISPDDPFCNIAGLNAIQYQQYSDECEAKSVCSWEFIAGDNSSEDGMIGTCVYNGGSGYYNPCVDCQIELIPLSPTVTDYCQTDDADFDILIRGHLGDAYGDDVHLGSLLMAVFDATAFNFVSSDDSEIDEEMGYEFDPPIPASATQITDSNGEAYWIVRLPNDNCHNTNPDDPDVFSCDNVYMRAYLLDPLYGESVDVNTTLYKNCQP
mgnify:CR=1 FL=1|tara:strand:+ start:280 stop:2811 length:2532 start_codon:yes stop_codon:yes gene_type:complete